MIVFHFGAINLMTFLLFLPLLSDKTSYSKARTRIRTPACTHFSYQLWVRKLATNLALHLSYAHPLLARYDNVSLRSRNHDNFGHSSALTQMKEEWMKREGRWTAIIALDFN